MVEQRRRLELVGAQPPVPQPRLDALPVVAVQRGMSQEHRDRLFTVLGHRRSQGMAEVVSLKVHEVTLTGRLVTANGTKNP